MPPQSLASVAPVSLPSMTVNSFAARAFGASTERYRTFLSALLAGLRAYELAQQKGEEYAASPVRVA